MNKAIRTTLAIAASGLLLSAIAMAQAGTTDKKDKRKSDQQHHSRVAKGAFWKHKKNQDSAKQPQPAHTTPQTSNVKAAKTTKTAAVKPVSAKTQKQTPKTSNAKASGVKKSANAKSSVSSKTSASSKSSAASKAKPKQKKAQMQTVSVKQ
jgi:hypothetical protein